MPSPVRRAEREIVPARHSRASAPPRSGTPAGRILLADPCADTVETMAWLLRLWGYAVETAASGPEALEAALADRPDVVLMELALPRLDGLQVARRLRQSAGEPIPLLVAVSGYGSEKDRARSREAGFDCHFVKPVCPEVVRAWLVTNCVHAGG
jgi:CheY-like chemotaxis protein